MNFIQGTQVALADGSGFIEDMTVTTDPIIEAPPPAVAGTLPKTGRAWLYKASSTLTQEPCVVTPLNPPPCVNSETGNDNPPVGAPSNDATQALCPAALRRYPSQRPALVADQLVGF